MTTVRDKKGRYAKGNTPWTKGRHRTKETKEKLSESLKISPKNWKGKHHTEEAKRKISEGLKEYYKTHDAPSKGKHCSEKTKKAVSKANTGRKFSKEHKRKLSLAHSGRRHTKEAKEKISKASIESQREESGPSKHYIKILEEAKNLESRGFRVIPLGKVVPDIIAIKDGKVYAIEIESKVRRAGSNYYQKYDISDMKKYFDDIIWIIRRER